MARSKQGKSKGKGKATTRRVPQVDIASAALLGALASTASSTSARQDPDAGAKDARATLNDAAAALDPALLPHEQNTDAPIAQDDALAGAEHAALPPVESELIAALSADAPFSDAASPLFGLVDETLAHDVAQAPQDIAAAQGADELAAADLDFGEARAAGTADADAGAGAHANPADADYDVKVAQAASGTATDAPAATAGSAPAAEGGAKEGAKGAEGELTDLNELPATGAGPAAPALAGLGGAGAAGAAAGAAGLAAASAGGAKQGAVAEDGTLVAGAVSKTLRIVDPPVKGAKVVYDANKNGKADADEAVGTTDDKGYINIAYKSVEGGQFLVFGGQDIVTGQKFGPEDLAGVLLDDGSGKPGIVSPISTLLAMSGGAVSEADLKTLLGLPTDTNLSTYDYYGEMEKGGAGAASATKALQLATLVDTVSKSASSYLSTDSTVDFGEKKSVSDAIGSALKLAAAQTTAGKPMDTASLSNLVTQVAVTTSAVIKSGTTDVTATLADLKTAFTAGTLDATVNAKLAALPNVNEAEVEKFASGVANLAAATSDAYQNFNPNATGAAALALDAKLDALAALSTALDSVAQDLSTDGNTSAGSDTLLAYLQSAGTINTLSESTQFQAFASNLTNSTTSTADSIATSISQAVSQGSSITGVNAPPVSNADAAALATSWLTPVKGNVLTNDTDIDGAVAPHVGLVNGVAGNVGAALVGTYGTLQLNADGSYNYVFDTTPAPGAIPLGKSLVDTFTYQALDDHGAASADATLDIAIPTYGAGHTTAAGTHLDTSYTGLKALGLNVVNPLDVGALFVSLDTAGGGAALSSAAVQSIIDGDHAAALPAFADQLNVSLDVTQSQVTSLVDILDGTVNGKYDGANAGVNLDSWGIDHIGLDSSQGGAASLALSAQEMLAIKDAGLDFARTDDIVGNINDATLTPAQTATLADWAVANGVDHLNVELTDAQAAAMGAAVQDLPDAAAVHLTASGSHLATSLNDMANLGVDSVDTTNAQHIIDVKLGINLPGSATINTDLEALLKHFKPDGVNVHEVFKPADNVVVELGATVNINDVSAQVLHELKLLGVDAIADADINGDGVPDHIKPTS